MNRITVIYENHQNPYNTELEPGHGFSAYIEFEGKKILFDTGWDGAILLRNCERLGIILNDLDAIIISHGHWDHMGGLAHVLTQAHNADIYIPDDFSNTQPKEYGRYLNDPYVQRMKNFSVLNRLSPNLAVTGTWKEMGPIGEQAVVIRNPETGNGLLVVGCLHPGLPIFVKAAEKFSKITSFIGGMHGFNDPQFVLSAGFKKLFLGHCTQHYEAYTNLSGIEMTHIYVGFQMLISEMF